MEYERLLREADKLGIIVKETKMKTRKGRCYGKRIAINCSLNNKEKVGVLAEELGHFHKTVGDISNQNEITNRKQELIARRWGYDKSIGIIGLIQAFEYGCTGRTEISEYLGVTESYLQEAIDYLKSKYGLWYEIDCYIICFEPSLGIVKKLEDF